MAKVLSLSVENFMKVKALEANVSGAKIVEVVGDNATGKSSVLRALQSALEGGKSAPDSPIHNGESKAKVIVQTDDYTITEKFSAKGGRSLEVVAVDGSAIKSPQALLDAMIGRVSFDPRRFTDADAKEQVNMLKTALGLSQQFDELDAKRKALYEERSGVNRDAAKEKGQLAALQHDKDAPTEEVSVSALAEQLKAAQAANKLKAARDNDLSDIDADIASISTDVLNLEAQIEKFRECIVQAQQAVADKTNRIVALKAEREQANANPLPDVPEQPIIDAMANAEAINTRFRKSQERAALVESLKTNELKAAKLTDAIDRLDREKRELVQQADLPVEGLEVHEDGLYYQGQPFSQASAAQRIRIACMIGLAQSPKLKVLLIEDGSLLGDESMAALLEMAEKYDAQIWIERVTGDQEVRIEIIGADAE